MATEAEKAAFKAAMAEPGNLDWAWSLLKKTVKECPEIIKRLNAHVVHVAGTMSGVSGCSTMEALASASGLADTFRTPIIKECLQAAFRYKYCHPPDGTVRSLTDGKEWDAFLKGEAPKGEVEMPEVGFDPDVAAEESITRMSAKVEAEESDDDNSAVLQALQKALKKGLDPKQVEALIEARVGPLRKLCESLPDKVGKTTQTLVDGVLTKFGTELTKLSDKIGKEQGGCTARFDTVSKELSTVVDRLGKVEANPRVEKIDPAYLDKFMRVSVVDLLGDVIKDGGISKGETAAVEDDKPGDGMFHPEVDETFIIRPKVKTLFKYWEELRPKQVMNIMLVGPKGCGKSSTPIQYAAKQKLPILIMDCANIREARDWFGYKTVRGSNVIWHESQFARAVAQGNVVIVFDELPRCGQHILNTLLPLLDDRRFTYIEEKGARLEVGPGVIFFATANEGHEYTGNSAVDAALADRFSRRVEVDYLPPSDESKVIQKRCGVSEDVADKLVDLANTLRKKAVGLKATLTKTISTRQLIAAAMDFQALGVDGLINTISSHYTADEGENSERAQVEQAIQGKFGK